MSLVAVETDAPWLLLPDTAFARVSIPRLEGQVTFNTSDANSTMHVVASGSAAKLVDISGVLSIEDVSAAVEIPEFDPDGRAPDTYNLTFNATGVLGGAGGFGLNMSGEITQEGEDVAADLYARHGGGWSPLPGSFVPTFKTPAFDGNVKLNWPEAAAHFVADFYVGYPSNLTLIEGVVAFTPYPRAAGVERCRNGSSGDGPFLCVEATQPDNFKPTR